MTTEQEPQHTPKLPHTSIVTTTAQLITLVLTLFACLAALYAISIAREGEQTINRIATTKKQNKDIDLDIQLATINEAHASLQHQLLHLSRKIELQQSSPAYNIWTSEQARYYLELVNVENKWGGDPAICISILRQAERLLKTIKSSSLAPVLKSIEETIQMLEKLPKTDYLDILNQINSLEDILNKIIHPDEVDTTNVEPLDPNSGHAVKVSIEHLKRLISIKQNQPTKKTELAIQHNIIIDRIGLNLLEAKLAFLRKNPDIYQVVLLRAISQAKLLPPSEQQKVILDALETLNKTQAFVKIPPLSAPLEALKVWIRAQPNLIDKNE